MPKPARCDYTSNWLRLANLLPRRGFIASLLACTLFCHASVRAKTAYVSSQIEGHGSDLIFCDLDGDGLKDLVLIDGLKLSIFFQYAQQGFSQPAQQQLKPEGRPFVVWPARLGSKAESLLLMTSDGITELAFTNRAAPPARQRIITQPTVVPEDLEQPSAMYLGLSPRTDAPVPLL